MAVSKAKSGAGWVGLVVVWVWLLGRGSGVEGWSLSNKERGKRDKEGEKGRRAWQWCGGWVRIGCSCWRSEREREREGRGCDGEDDGDLVF
ncbi:unnamed protein product [Prunus armeniaca]